MRTDIEFTRGWEIRHLLARLDPGRLHHELEILCADAEAIAKKTETLFKTEGTQNATNLVEQYLRLDQRFDALGSIVTLGRMSRVDSERLQLADQALANTENYLYHQTAPLISKWRMIVEEDKPFLASQPVYQEWLIALKRIEAAAVNDCDFAEVQHAIGEDWHDLMHSASQSPSGDFDQGKVEALAELLQKRVASDCVSADSVKPESLKRWAYLNAVEIDAIDTLLKGDERQEMQTYVQEIQRRAGLSHCTLEAFRALEQDLMAIPQLTVDEAVAMVLTGLKTFDSVGACIAQRLVNEHRLEVQTLSEDSDSGLSPPLCIDTPFGAFVRVNFQPDMLSLMLLMHELGHAIEYEKRRDSGRGHIPLTAVASEWAALAAERKLALWLMDQGELWKAPARHYLRYQTMEMNHRHRILGLFEVGLHGLTELTPKTINQYWLQVNQDLYGPTIQLAAGFETAWCELHHLFTAPWYLLAYPLSIQQLNDQMLCAGLKKR